MDFDAADLALTPLPEPDTLPSKWYVSDALFELEQRLIFRRSWQFVANIAQLEKPGDYVTAEIFGEPIVVVRDAAGALTALSAVCTHRGGAIAVGEGNQSSPFFQCKYHSWTFNFDGSMRGAPGLAITDGDRAKLCLPKVRIETWRSLVFVNLDDGAPTLATVMQGVDQGLRVDPLGDLKFQFRETFEMACNWKVFQYNSHECYHCRTIHPETICNVLYPESLETLRSGAQWLYTRYAARAASQGSRASDVQSFAAGTEDVVQRSSGDLADDDPERGFFALHLFPNTMITYTPPGYAMLVRVIPQAAGRTLLIRDHHFADADATKVESVRSFREAVTAEDIEICETVQRNMSSRLFQHGRFVEKREWQAQWFEQRVRETIVRGLTEVGG